jgi:hypothetical protein
MGRSGQLVYLGGGLLSVQDEVFIGQIGLPSPSRVTQRCHRGVTLVKTERHTLRGMPSRVTQRGHTGASHGGETEGLQTENVGVGSVVIPPPRYGPHNSQDTPPVSL